MNTFLIFNSSILMLCILMKNVTPFVNVDKRDESKSVSSQSVSNENNEVKRNNFESSNKNKNLSLEQFDEVDMMDNMISDGEHC